MTSSIFTGLSAFPLTPLHDDKVDEEAFADLITRLVVAGVDSITVLGSTGSYAYLTPSERARIAELAVEHAGSTPVFVGVGDLRTSHVLAHVEAAEQAGAAGLLLAPMTYQALTADDVFELYCTVTEHTGLPIIVYDNPNTTHLYVHDRSLHPRRGTAGDRIDQDPRRSYRPQQGARTCEDAPCGGTQTCHNRGFG